MKPDVGSEVNLLSSFSREEHEHGEKNSKYFLNLEKRNHIKKHIRKLRLSGVITTDPFEILDAGKTFYENLYKSNRNSQLAIPR